MHTIASLKSYSYQEREREREREIEREREREKEREMVGRFSLGVKHGKIHITNIFTFGQMCYDQ